MKNSGITIGGKHPGEYHAIEGEYLNLPIPLDISKNIPIGPCEIPNEPIANSIEIYKHISMSWYNDQTKEKWKFGFWVLVNIENPQPYILDLLLDCYRNAH